MDSASLLVLLCFVVERRLFVPSLTSSVTTLLNTWLGRTWRGAGSTGNWTSDGTERRTESWKEDTETGVSRWGAAAFSWCKILARGKIVGMVVCHSVNCILCVSVDQEPCNGWRSSLHRPVLLLRDRSVRSGNGHLGRRKHWDVLQGDDSFSLPLFMVYSRNWFIHIFALLF